MISRDLVALITDAIEKEATETALVTGRTRFNAEEYSKRLGVYEGLQRAIGIVKDIARAYEEDDD